MVNGSLCNLFALASLRVTLSLLHRADETHQVETAVHGCNPILLASVMLVSRKVNVFT